VKTAKRLAGFVAALAVYVTTAAAADPYLYKFTFKGTAYQKDGTGRIVGVPITDQTLLADRAAAGGVDPSTLAIAYHVAGDEKGDTVEIVSASTGARQAFQFGFWFGDDRTTPLGRSALTNSALTEFRSVEQVFTLEDSTYTAQNGHGLGTVCLTKRFVRDTDGVLHATIEGLLQWQVPSQDPNRSTKICNGTFIVTQPLF
jgi:hypothetical protein